MTMKVYFEDEIRFGIPLNEYYLARRQQKGLMFVIHRLNASKDTGPGLIPKRLAELGYHVVSIDAYKHGERVEEPYITGSEKQRLTSMIEVINQTVLDIKFLYDNYYRDKFARVSFFGIAMGGIVAYQMPRIMTNVDTVVAIQASPYLKSLYHDKELKYIYKNMNVQEREVADEYLDKLDLSDSLEAFANVAVYGANRKEDLLIKPDYAIRFIQHLKLLGNMNVCHQIVEGNHETINIMAEGAINWLKQPKTKSCNDIG
ncbi:MAG: hypothetical protein JXB20_02210 [Bacilli bacterium]|nr:hypothetical protein [Bacilli bacterium]MBN2696785.1 hypothetical protein [Bacilli bacterium]